MTTPPTLIDFTRYVHNRLNNKKILYVRDIKHTLKYYNQDTKGKKKVLIERLDAFFTSIKNMEKYTREIIIIQKYIRGYITRHKFKNKSYYFRHRCNNTEDFYTFQSIDDIEELYFFSYTDKDNFTYFFDIRSFEKLKQGGHTNPYNREHIPQEVMDKFTNRMEIIYKDKNFKPFEKIKLTDEQKYRNYVIEIFQKIDATECIASGTNINWYLNLDFNQTINFYKILEDIWIYRASLTNQQRDLIVPDRNIFNRNEFEYLYKNRTKKKYKRVMEYFILKNMDKLISSANESSHKATGAYYILIALIDVSIDCANSLPWLIQ
jgi:hypothetical protein